MDTTALIHDLNRTEGWQLKEGLTAGQLEEFLAEVLNGWIRTDFNKLVQFLYNIDVSESRLKLLLKENAGEDTGRLIARLVLERQWQKIQTRQQFKPGNAISDEERW
jgi:hypothetical protein